jgi:hypothetical protein
MIPIKLHGKKSKLPAIAPPTKDVKMEFDGVSFRKANERSLMVIWND